MELSIFGMVLVILPEAPQRRMSKLMHDEHDGLCIGPQSSCSDQIIHNVFNPIDQLPFAGNEPVHLGVGMDVIKLDQHDLSACPPLARARLAAFR